VSPGQSENVLIIGLPAVGTFDVIEIYASVLNDRSGAVLVDSVGGSTYRHQLTGGVTRFYWVRARRGAAVSAWLPASATAGIAGTTFARFIARGNCQVIGDVARKVGGVAAAWDSDVYSPDQYSNGCFVTFRADQTNRNVIVGLNSDPTTDQTYTGIDYCIHCSSDGRAYIFEDNVNILDLGVYTTSTVFTVSHDGKFIKYFMGGALVRQKPVTGTTLFMDSSFFNPEARISALQFGPLNAVTPSPWVARGNCIAGVTTARKSDSGSAAWDSDIYSIDSYRVCHVKFKPSQANQNLMIGLNTDPATNQSFDSLDFAWFCKNNGTAEIYESGTLIGSPIAYSVSTEFAITYDSSNVRYYIDNILLRTAALASATLFADASFFNPSAAVNSLHFGPGTALEMVGTPGIEPNAATSVMTSAGGSGSITGTLASPQTLMSLSVPAQGTDTTIVMTFVANMRAVAVEFGGSGIWAYINSSSVGIGYDSTQSNARCYAEAASSSQVNSVAVEETFSLPANTARTYNLYAFRTGGGASGSASYSSGVVKAEIIKR
jgi:hypothetical protein